LDIVADDIVVLIADAVRLRAIREVAPFPYRMLYFSDSNLASALGTIRAHAPCRIALDTQFAHTSSGRNFADKLQSPSMAGSEVFIVSFDNGRWSMLPVEGTSASAIRSATFAAAVVAVADLNVNLNTRRVPRFLVMDTLAAVVDGKKTSLIDMSVMGAQVTSAPVLRPNQVLRIALPDEDDTILQLTAHIAWSAFQTSKNMLAPYYRAGMEFTDASAQLLEQYCRRHCSDAPIPPGR
jgi:hypothetical protein